MNLKSELLKLKNPAKAKILSSFFKTGIGQYGEGDRFLGVTVPETRKVAKQFSDLNLQEIKKFLHDEFHEVRLCALLVLVHKFEKSKQKEEREKIFKFYFQNARYVNNWDLVDQTAPKIVGCFLFDKKRELLHKLAKSENLWEKRISIVSTFYFIYHGQSNDTYKITKILINDKHDLIQKAAGWMLREAGKRVSEKELLQFLDKHSKKMPRTMLRYAIERLPEKKRKYYLER